MIEHLAYFRLARWMLLQAHLLHVAIVRVRVAKQWEKFTDLDSFRPDIELIWDFIEKFSVLVDDLDDVVKVFWELCHIDSKLDECFRIFCTAEWTLHGLVRFFIHRESRFDWNLYFFVNTWAVLAWWELGQVEASVLTFVDYSELTCMLLSECTLIRLSYYLWLALVGLKRRLWVTMITLV